LILLLVFFVLIFVFVFFTKNYTGIHSTTRCTSTVNHSQFVHREMSKININQKTPKQKKMKNRKKNEQKVLNVSPVDGVKS